jgi:hypothetical protein
MLAWCVQERTGGRSHGEDPGIVESIILKWIFKGGIGGMNWIDLAQDRDRWWGHVNAVINIWGP